MQITDTALAAADHLQFMRDVAAAAVPKLGDWCSIHFQPEAGAPFEVVVAHADPARVEWADTLSKRFPYNPDGDHGIPLVIRTGRTEFIERVTDDFIDAALERGAVRSRRDAIRARRPGAHQRDHRATHDGAGHDRRDAVRRPRSRAGPTSATTSRSPRSAASRIADALDNMWLTGQHRHISATLQRSLLPPKLPEIDGIDLAVRYWPAGAAVAAGGDFYDVFAIAPSTWSLLIGDVCGTGPDAAALTGITRHTVRAAARHGPGPPLGPRMAQRGDATVEP